MLFRRDLYLDQQLVELGSVQEAACKDDRPDMLNVPDVG
jgi:hypothetical protein